MKHKEMYTGINGSGNKIWIVVTVCDKTSRWLCQETFTREAEAKSWFKYA